MKKFLIVVLLLGVLVFLFAPQTLAYNLGAFRNNLNRMGPYMNSFSNRNIYLHHQRRHYGERHKNQWFNFSL